MASVHAAGGTHPRPEAPGGTEPPAPPDPPRRRPPGRGEIAVETVLGGSRLLMGIAVITLLGVTVTALGYGCYVFVRTLGAVFAHPDPVAPNLSGFLVVIDLFLIAATMLIAAIGLYELFISRIDPPGAAPLPAWLQMRDLNDLKTRVIAMIVLLAAVTFIDVLVDFQSASDVLEAGAGVALVVLSLTAFIRVGGQPHSGS